MRMAVELNPRPSTHRICEQDQGNLFEPRFQVCWKDFIRLVPSLYTPVRVCIDNKYITDVIVNRHRTLVYS